MASIPSFFGRKKSNTDLQNFFQLRQAMIEADKQKAKGGDALDQLLDFHRRKIAVTSVASGSPVYTPNTVIYQSDLITRMTTASGTWGTTSLVATNPFGSLVVDDGTDQETAPQFAYAQTNAPNQQGNNNMGLITPPISISFDLSSAPSAEKAESLRSIAENPSTAQHNFQNITAYEQDIANLCELINTMPESLGSVKLLEYFCAGVLQIAANYGFLHIGHADGFDDYEADCQHCYPVNDNENYTCQLQRLAILERTSWVIKDKLNAENKDYLHENMTRWEEKEISADVFFTSDDCRGDTLYWFFNRFQKWFSLLFKANFVRVHSWIDDYEKEVLGMQNSQIEICDFEQLKGLASAKPLSFIQSYIPVFEYFLPKPTEAKPMTTETSTTPAPKLKDGMYPYAKYLLGKEGNKTRKKWLQTFLNCKLPQEAADLIQEAMVMIDSSKIFDDWGINEHFEKGLTNAILLYGPPGTGKSMVAESLAALLGKDLLKIGTAELQSQIPGQMERNVQNAFKQAKEKKAVLMFDECDSLLYNREFVGAIMAAEINTLLTELENHEGVVVFTTNRIHKLDPAVDRRVICKIPLDPPDQATRAQIWQALIPSKMPLVKNEAGEVAINFEDLSVAEFTGGEIKNALLLGVRRAVALQATAVSQEHFEYGIMKVLKSKSQFEGARDSHFNKQEAKAAFQAEKSGGSKMKLTKQQDSDYSKILQEGLAS